jgi:hypothetical protein
MSTPPVVSEHKREGEAATALTDGLLALQSGYYACQPCRHAPVWRAVFGAVALAALLGAAYHGLPPHVLPRVRAALWKGVGVATGAAGALLLVGGILASSAAGWRRVGVAGALLKSVVLGVNTWRRDDFRYIIYDYGTSLLALLALQGWRPTPASPSIRWGIMLSFLAAAIQQMELGLHRRFDHNALYHVVQMAALHYFDQGARRLRAR